MAKRLSGGCQMQLRVVDGELTFGSIQKICSCGIFVGFGVFMVPLLLLITAVALIGGEISFNGEMVRDRGQILMLLVPFAIMMPIALAWNAFIFGALMAFAVKLYSRWRPITVAVE